MSDQSKNSSNSDESSSSENSEESLSSNSSKEQQLEVPDSVIRRFFSSENVLRKFFQKGSKVFVELAEDVCKTYKMCEESQNEMTELAYVLHQRLKGQEWAPLFSEALLNLPTNQTHLGCLLFCILKFDKCFLAKVLLHSLK